MSEDLETRVARLEELFRGVDRDQADQGTKLSALRHLVQAVSITQSEHTETLARQGEQLARVEAGVGQILALLNTLVARGDG